MQTTQILAALEATNDETLEMKYLDDCNLPNYATEIIDANYQRIRIPNKANYGATGNSQKYYFGNRTRFDSIQVVENALLNKVHEDILKALDLGCGAGAVAREIKRKYGFAIRGISATDFGSPDVTIANIEYL